MKYILGFALILGCSGENRMNVNLGDNNPIEPAANGTQVFTCPKTYQVSAGGGCGYTVDYSAQKDIVELSPTYSTLAFCKAQYEAYLLNAPKTAKTQPCECAFAWTAAYPPYINEVDFKQPLAKFTTGKMPAGVANFTPPNPNSDASVELVLDSAKNIYTMNCYLEDEAHSSTKKMPLSSKLDAKYTKCTIDNESSKDKVACDKTNKCSVTCDVT